MEGKRLLVIGQGGREHALAWKLAQSEHVANVFVAPGNAGTANEDRVENVAIPVDHIEELLAFAREQRIDLTVVGPELPLSLGVVDRFLAAGLRIFGPTRAAAELESSKAFAKSFLAQHGIPTAHYAVFEDRLAALDHVRRLGAPIVIKADGLAAGKGVVVAMSLAEAEAALQDMLGTPASADGARPRVVIEQFLQGEELSYIVVAQGECFVPLSSAQDHKRVGDGDTGPNTGGMGAYSPAPIMDAALEARIQEQIIRPTLKGMSAMGRPFCGFLYAGIMVQEDGSPMVLEFNTRLGDPETQPLLFRLNSDLLGLFEAALDGRLAALSLDWDSRVALAVVMAAEGYPGTVRKGDRIQGLEETDDSAGAPTKVFHAGTLADAGGAITSGGRVLAVTALGATVMDAQALAHARAARIHWTGAFFRRDIGWRALARERANPVQAGSLHAGANGGPA